MRQSRSSGSVEGVMGNHDSYSDSFTHPLRPCYGTRAQSGYKQRSCKAYRSGSLSETVFTRKKGIE